MTYAEQLKSPKWQKKRLEILERDDFACVACGDKERQLHVHHGYYEKDRLLWDYEEETLHTLCNHCHELTHENLLEIKYRIAYFNPKDISMLNEIISQVFFHNNKELAMENIKFFFDLINGYE